MADAILDVDLLAFEQRRRRRPAAAVVDGVRRSLATGFVYTSHDLPEDLLDERLREARGVLLACPAEVKQQSVAPGTNGQTGYTGLLVETAASVRAPGLEGDAQLGGRPVQEGTRCAPGTRTATTTRCCPRPPCPASPRCWATSTTGCRCCCAGSCGSSPWGSAPTRRCSSRSPPTPPTSPGRIHYPPMQSAPGAEHVWAGEHGDINLITALPRATAKGLQVKTDDGGWIDAVPPERPRRHQHRDHARPHLQRADPHRHPPGRRRPDRARRPLLRRAVLPPDPVGVLAPLPSCITPENPQRHVPVDAGSLLDQVLWEINLVEDGRRV